jgi:hypothetical protein
MLEAYWLARFLFERALAAVYLIAFLNAANQFLPLLGERGLLPVPRFITFVPFRSAPSLFHIAPRDVAFRYAARLGIGLAAFALFAGGSETTPNLLLLLMWRWVLFRVMFGAGLIKLRGDPCWRDLTCLHYYFETQPIPNALSWYLHRLPSNVKRAGVAFNHLVELAVPFLYFAPQPFAAIGGLLTIAFQLILIVSGNLSWLNWITIVLCIPTIDDRWWLWLTITSPVLETPATAHRLLVTVVAAIVLVLSVQPVRNMLSRRQLMNYSFNPLHIVNTYGAFGSITRTRHEIVIEGTSHTTVTARTEWRAYEFRGKPGDPSRRPPQIAPYHLRLDWLMWFAAMSPPSHHPWFMGLLLKLLSGDRSTLGLLRTNPFPDAPPRWIRAILYEYHLSSPDERRATRHWWTRREIGPYVPPCQLHASEQRHAPTASARRSR